MTYAAKLHRQAARLGVTLPADDDEVVTWDEGGFASVGENTLYEGNGAGECRLTFGDDGWTVTLIGTTARAQGSKSPRQPLVGTFRSLDEAMKVVRFLQNRRNRRAWRGLAPKERQAVVKANAHLTPDGAAALKELLTNVNGGAVRITN